MKGFIRVQDERERDKYLLFNCVYALDFESILTGGLKRFKTKCTQ
jgi:hypothetical protein